jgi:hypothetical protein
MDESDAAARTRAEAAVELLEGVLSGHLATEVALEHWPSIDTENDDFLTASWHDLWHFAADEDIRAKDPDYAEYQTQLLARRVREIRDKFDLG